MGKYTTIVFIFVFLLPLSAEDIQQPVWKFHKQFNPETTISFCLTTESTRLRQDYAGQAEST